MKLVVAFKFFLMLLGCFIWISCKTTKQYSQTKSTADKLNILKEADVNNKIVFLTFSVACNDSLLNKTTFRLINVLQSPGQLKQGYLLQDFDRELNYYYCELLSKSGERIGILKVPDPLSKIYEYPTEQKKLETTIIKKKNGEFTIRFQGNPEIKYLSIYKYDEAELKEVKKIYDAQF